MTVKTFQRKIVFLFVIPRVSQNAAPGDKCANLDSTRELRENLPPAKTVRIDFHNIHQWDFENH